MTETSGTPPTISSLEPDRGAMVGGTRVVLTGAGFAEGCRVRVGGAEVPASFHAADSLSFVTPPSVQAGSVEIRVVLPGLESEPSSFEFEASPAPVIVSLSPKEGVLGGGTEVTIAGLHFVQGCRVEFGSAQFVAAEGAQFVDAPVLFDAPIQIRVRAPAHLAPGVVDVRLIHPDGQTATLESAFTYLRPSPPRIERVAPQLGPALGGTAVEIAGAGLSESTRVELDGVVLTARHRDGALQIITPPRREGGSVYLRVVNADGQFDMRSEGFIYDAPRAPPVLMSIEPRRALANSEARITLDGEAFDPDSRVEIGGQQARVEHGTERRLIVVAPARGAIGRVDVRVVNPDGQLHLTSQAFEYALPTPPPAIAGVAPLHGPVTGGTSVMIRGANFEDDLQVFFGELQVAATFDGVSALRLSTPAQREAGPVNVRVVRSDGESHTLEGGFRYDLLSPPVIHSVAPTRGPVTGGTRVQITGAEFCVNPATVVRVGKNVVTATSTGASTITLVMPPGDVGAIDLHVHNPDGQSASRPRAFEYEALAKPSITSIDPKTGSTAGGFRLVIVGRGFADGAVVIVRGEPAKTRRVDETTLEAVAPAVSAPGFADVQVKNPDRQVATMQNAIRYDAPRR